MSPQFKEQLTRLIKGNPYSLPAVLEAIKTGQMDIVQTYYYPVCLQKAYDQFKDEEEANQAAFELLDHLTGETPKILEFDESKGKLSSWFDVVAKHFFNNYYNRVLSKKPDITYGHETLEAEEDDYGDGDSLLHVSRPHVWEEPRDYPYDGTDTDDPETLALRKEEAEETGTLLNDLRESLYPADQQVLDLLLEHYTSDEVAERLGRTRMAVETSIKRIRQATKNAV